MQSPIIPLAKPRYRSPIDRPVHFHDRNKAPRPKFPETKRYGSWLNKLAVTDTPAIEIAHKRCIEMKKAEKETLKPFIVRYKRVFDPIEKDGVKRGLSFRGRGRLDIKMGWSTVTQIDPESDGDISMAMKSDEQANSGKVGSIMFEQITANSINRNKTTTPKLETILSNSRSALTKPTVKIQSKELIASTPVTATKPELSRSADVLIPVEKPAGTPEPTSARLSAKIPSGTTASPIAIITPTEITSVKKEVLPMLPSKPTDINDEANASPRPSRVQFNSSNASPSIISNPWVSPTVIKVAQLSPIKTEAPTTDSSLMNAPTPISNPENIAEPSRVEEKANLEDKKEEEDEDSEWIRQQKQAMYGGWRSDSPTSNNDQSPARDSTLKIDSFKPITPFKTMNKRDKLTARANRQSQIQNTEIRSSAVNAPLSRLEMLMKQEGDNVIKNLNETISQSSQQNVAENPWNASESSVEVKDSPKQKRKERTGSKSSETKKNSFKSGSSINLHSRTSSDKQILKEKQKSSSSMNKKSTTDLSLKQGSMSELTKGLFSKIIKSKSSSQSSNILLAEPTDASLEARLITESPTSIEFPDKDAVIQQTESKTTDESSETRNLKYKCMSNSVDLKEKNHNAEQKRNTQTDGKDYIVHSKSLIGSISASFMFKSKDLLTGDDSYDQQNSATHQGVRTIEPHKNDLIKSPENFILQKTETDNLDNTMSNNFGSINSSKDVISVHEPDLVAPTPRHIETQLELKYDTEDHVESKDISPHTLKSTNVSMYSSNVENEDQTRNSANENTIKSLASQQPEVVDYDTLNIKLGRKAGQFLNAMDVQNIEGANVGYNNVFSSYPPSQPIVLSGKFLFRPV